jgi:hypothetical protein
VRTLRKVLLSFVVDMMELGGSGSFSSLDFILGVAAALSQREGVLVQDVKGLR